MEWLHIFSKLLLSNECHNGVRYFLKEDSYFSAVVLTRCFKKVKMCVPTHFTANSMTKTLMKQVVKTSILHTPIPRIACILVPEKDRVT